MFFVAWGITNSELGVTVSGAKLKYVLWGSGLVVEVFSHVRMSRINWRPSQFNYKNKLFWRGGAGNEELDTLKLTPVAESRSIVGPSRPPELPIPESDVTLRSRLEAITTIILGEVG
jgi:hypothetical protein